MFVHDCNFAKRLYIISAHKFDKSSCSVFLWTLCLQLHLTESKHFLVESAFHWEIYTSGKVTSDKFQVLNIFYIYFLKKAIVTFMFDFWSFYMFLSVSNVTHLTLKPKCTKAWVQLKNWTQLRAEDGSRLLKCSWYLRMEKFSLKRNILSARCCDLQHKLSSVQKLCINVKV